MPASLNPYDQQVADLNAAILKVEDEWRYADSRRHGYALAELNNARDSPAWLSAVAEAAKWTAVMRDKEAEKANLQKQLDNAMKLQADFAAAMAAGLAKGLDPATAAAQAQAAVMKADGVKTLLTYAGIGLLVLLLVVALVYFLRRRKK